MANGCFQHTKQPPRLIRTRVTGGKSDSSSIRRQLVKKVIASKHLDPAAQCEVLFDHIERITASVNDARNALEKMSVWIAAFDLAANFRFATFAPNRSWKKAAQTKRRAFCNLLKKHQRFPNRLRRGEKIPTGDY